MILGYLVPEFPSQTHTFFWREVQSLREQGLQVVLLSTRRPPGLACRHEFAAVAAAETVYLYPPRWGTCALRLATRPGSTLRALRYVAGLVETPLLARARLAGLLFPAAELSAVAARTGLDHIHVHSCAGAAHLAALTRILRGPSYSLTLHGDLAVYGTDHARKMARAAFVATVTRPLQDAVVAQVGLAPSRVPWIRMGVDTEHFRSLDRPPGVRGRLHVVTVARLNPSKGHQHALAAVRALVDRGDDIRYTIAGDGPHRSAIEAEIERLRLSERVVLAGSLAEGEVLALLRECDAFVLPSIGLGEAAPVSVMEAMACGLPVVSSIIGGTGDMITHGRDGLLVQQGDEIGLEDALGRLAADVGLRAELGRAARARALTDFDHRVMAAKLRERIEAARAQAS